MKLIIDIPEERLDSIKHFGIKQNEVSMLERALISGTPLDEIKAEIAEEICLTDNPYTKETKYTIEHLKLLEILDNIGKESEE